MSAATRPSPAQILTAVSDLSGIPLDTLSSPRQVRHIGRIRSVAAYLLRLDAGLTAKQAGRLLGRSDQTVFDLTKHARAALANRDTVADVIELVRRALVTVEATQPTVSVSPSPRRQPYPLPHLARWRTFAGWTQAHLAKHSGIALTTIVRLERGRRAQLESVRLLADALLVAPSVLTGATVLDSLTGEAYRQCRDCGASRLSGG